ncbi:MAG: hypothetical protein KAV82_10240 [Phycisphaerae bacterium]|nr:hypothetical protein [Phycisphaerae bacterium]
MSTFPKPKLMVVLVLGGASFLFSSPDPVCAQEALIVDHTCTKIGAVPDYWVEQAKISFWASYGHTSHGSQIVTGMATFNSTLGCSCSSCGDPGCTSCLYGYCDDYAYYAYGGSNPMAPVGTLSFWDRKPAGANDLGNPDRIAWEAATRAMLEDPDYDNRNFVMWSWCGQADTTEENMQTYLDLMSGLVDDYPNVTFIYMTGHLVGTGETGNLHQRNNQIRNHVIATGGVLFDFADIESYDPDWNYFRDLNATDSCDYWIDSVRHNWADEWCAANPGSDLCASCSCAHSRSLNCNLKGRAFWWMMARLAGWPGPAVSDLDRDGDVDLDDFAGFIGCLAGPEVTTPPGGCTSGRFDSADLDSDGDVDLADFNVFQAEFTGS